MDHETTQRNKSLVQSKFDEWRAGRGSPLDLLAADVTWTIVGHSVLSRTYHGREEFTREVLRPFRARLRTGLQPVLRNLYTEGDTVISLFDASAMALDGEPYHNTYAWFFNMRDSRVVSGSAFFDSVALNALWYRVEPAGG